jgi:putative transposase
MRWRQIKSAFSRALPRREQISRSRETKGERGIWQRRYWEHTLGDERDVARHVDYIHFNPVKHGHVSRVQDWPYSSFHRMVEAGVYPSDWGGEVGVTADEFGEPR